MRFSRLPKKVRVQHEKEYGKIFRINRWDWKCVYCIGLLDDDETPVEGLCVYEEKTIYVDTTSTEIIDTIIHELAHAEIEALGFDLPDEDEEKLVKAFAGMISVNFNILKKNSFS